MKIFCNLCYYEPGASRSLPSARGYTPPKGPTEVKVDSALEFRKSMRESHKCAAINLRRNNGWKNATIDVKLLGSLPNKMFNLGFWRKKDLGERGRGVEGNPQAQPCYMINIYF